MDNSDKNTKKKSKQGKNEGRKESKKKIPWALYVFFLSLLISAAMSFLSGEMLAGAGLTLAFAVLLAFILLGIVFDIIGMAVTAADERPFHSMAAHRTPGAREALRLIRKANQVSSFCNDVVGDICGVVSGSASATIAAQILSNFDMSWPQIVSLGMSALAAGLTVGGKAIGKSFAVNSCTEIVHTVGRLVHSLKQFPELFRKKPKAKKK